ncbi:unnamed protein product [Adineta ricciae]|uniref:Uncharacterized protein n=1 Tax=Adineta ricciae TaxID=249248 RepID=A0A815R813_ADIRI|nr:unnamed protein product [Adineta ricciae]CAF1473479.1 unnamed protein product [Adineta ricciae]
MMRTTQYFITFFVQFFLINSSDIVPLDVGVHLFVDEQYIENMTSLEFQNGHIEKDLDHPLVYPEYPWEAAVHFYNSFLQVPSNLSTTGAPMYMIYYACVDSSAIIYNDNVSVCVANSSDGIHWEKPLFWYYPYTANGTKPAQATNIVFTTNVNEFLGTVFIDTRPGTTRSEIFKMSYENEFVRYVYVATSEDGFRWKAGIKPAHPLAGLSDTQTAMFYSSENGGQYVLYGRADWFVRNSSVYCPGANPAFRRVMVTTSSGDIYGPWTIPMEAFALGVPDPVQCFDNYNPAALYYYGVYFIFPSGYWHWPVNDSGAPIPLAAANDGVMDIRLAISRTALGPYRFPTRDPFISRGIGTIDPKTKLVNGTGSDRDAGFVFASSNGLMDPDFIRSDVGTPSAWMYHIYWGSQTTHAGGGTVLGRYWPGAYSGIFRARLRREGYVALSTLVSEPTGFGEFISQILSLPVKKNGQQLLLHINAEIATAGGLAVQFEDGLTRNPIPGFTFDECKTLHGNGIRQLLEWKTRNGTYSGDLNPLIDYPNGLRVHLQMTHTKLYSWLLSYV